MNGPTEMRVFIPATARLLAAWAEAGEIGGIAVAHAVTPALQRWLGQAEADELEYVALGEAAEACLRLLAADADSPRHRIVLAADVDLLLAPAGARAPYSLVSIGEPVSMRRVVSVLVDDSDAVPAVERAVGGVRDGVTGEEFEALLDQATGHELMWFDVTEVPHVLGLVAGR